MGNRLLQELSVIYHHIQSQALILATSNLLVILAENKYVTHLISPPPKMMYPAF
jgi:hypothetical protein